MSSQHTPGPWVIHRPNDSERIDINAEGSFYIAEVIGGMTAQEANAHLIAAAPDLLEALEELEALGSLELPQRRDAALLKAKAAIAKAKGE
jgi:hypothetical protein